MKLKRLIVGNVRFNVNDPTSSSTAGAWGVPEPTSGLLLLKRRVCLLLGTLAALSACSEVVFENEVMRLALDDQARATSLVVKATGEECVTADEGVPFFSVTQERPFNNEIKLAHPNKRTTYPANRLRREGEKLVVGFETAPYEAVVKTRQGKGYVAFELEDFRCTPASYPIVAETEIPLDLDVPPAVAFRVAQLPVRHRQNFGDWLNVVWDEKAAVAVVGCDPYCDIDNETRKDCRILRGDVLKGFKLRGGAAAVVVGAGKDAFLDSMDGFEVDYGLPRGVKSRRSPLLNRSICWTAGATPENIDSHIELAKQGGFSMMLFYFTCFSPEGGYSVLGDYDWNRVYPEKERTLTAMLDKVRAAGIHPGFHTLQSHIGCKSRYVTPVLDPRLNKTRRFTLASAIPAQGEVGEIRVLENPIDAPRYKTVRVLAFGGEAFSYESYTTEPPYRFTGVRRGHWQTKASAHPRGEIGGVLDVSEFGAASVYIDQATDLQDEIAQKIKRICDCGMEFCYFDGSEGVNPPCNVNVALSQYRVTSVLANPPLFTEGAAKSHFSWHLQAGANAFDTFAPEKFKGAIVKHPQAEAPMMEKNMTRIDFGWWSLVLPGERDSIGTQPDMWEFGTSRAAAWDCPATVQIQPDCIRKHPRHRDLLEVMRRWEDVRARGWLTPEQKAALKSPSQEHHLYLNERGDYELVPIEMLTADKAGLRAFLFARGGKRVVALWHTSGSGEFDLGPLGRQTVSDRRYIETELSADVLRRVFGDVRLCECAKDPWRPQLHYTPWYGWVNDPNGLVFYKGEWHLFCQHNPFGTEWGNMHWNHAVSTDLLHWREIGEALAPFGRGTIFSGSAVVDREGVAGFGRDAQVLFYTHAIDNAGWIQRLAWSTDGRTYRTLDGEPTVACRSQSNRDPKVFWHEPSKRWIMALYGEEDQHHVVWIYNSTDLRKWTPLSSYLGDKLTKDYFRHWLYECPGLEELQIEGEAATAWVVWGAWHEYAVGSFDGVRFTPTEERLPGVLGEGYYAAQTFNDVPDGRKLWIPWFMLPMQKGASIHHTLGLPQELTLRRTEAGLRMVRRPARELAGLRDSRELPFDQFEGELAEIHVDCQMSPAGRLSLDLRGVPLTYDAATETLSVADSKTKWPLVGGRLSLAVYLDRVCAEVFSDDGLKMLPVPSAFPDPSVRKLSVKESVGVTSQKLTAYRLKSIYVK